VLIALIGRHWLSATDEEGKRRLDQPEDFVRLEVATALKRGIRVIPVLVDGASMPRSGELPDALKSLVRRQAVIVSHERFRADAERLIGAMDQVLESTARIEQGRAEAERREREEKERLEAERRQKEAQDRLEAERQEGGQYEKLEQPAKGMPRVSASPTPSPAECLAEAKRYLDAKDYANALPLLQKAAEAGDAKAMDDLGELYYSGRGAPKDYAQARQWYEKAAKVGNSDAMTNLGVLYHEGQGVAQDYAKAREWYQKAAEAGNAGGMALLGVLYQSGQGVAQDYYAKARDWYQKAADAGDATAMNNLGVLYHEGQGVTQDYGKARQWYQKAADAGNAMAKQNLRRLPFWSKLFS